MNLNQLPLASSDFKWYVIHTHARSEVNVATALERKGYDVMVPLHGKVARKPSALFPGYIFCRVDPNYSLPVLQTRGVLALVRVGKTPVALEGPEYDKVRALTNARIDADPWPGLCRGERVRITSGPLSGVFGVLSEIRGVRRVALTLDLVQRSVLLNVPTDHVEEC